MTPLGFFAMFLIIAAAIGFGTGWVMEFIHRMRYLRIEPRTYLVFTIVSILIGIVFYRWALPPPISIADDFSRFFAEGPKVSSPIVVGLGSCLSCFLTSMITRVALKKWV